MISVKYKYIEFLGMPGAGKTIQAHMLLEKLRCILVDVDQYLPQEVRDISKYKNTAKFITSFNIEYVNYLRSIVYEYKNKVVILDRGFLDTFIWGNTHYQLGTISYDQKTILLKLAKIPEEIKPFYVPIVFLVPPVISMKRRAKFRSVLDKFVINPLYLNTLYKNYRSLARKYNLKIIDGTINPKKILEELVDYLTK